MFRIGGPGMGDPTEERRKVRENVKNNLIAFIAMCTILRLSRLCEIFRISVYMLMSHY